jgi:hypothetical protein
MLLRRVSTVLLALAFLSPASISGETTTTTTTTTTQSTATACAEGYAFSHSLASYSLMPPLSGIRLRAPAAVAVALRLVAAAAADDDDDGVATAAAVAIGGGDVDVDNAGNGGNDNGNGGVTGAWGVSVVSRANAQVLMRAAFVEVNRGGCCNAVVCSVQQLSFPFQRILFTHCNCISFPPSYCICHARTTPDNAYILRCRTACVVGVEHHST